MPAPATPPKGAHPDTLFAPPNGAVPAAGNASPAPPPHPTENPTPSGRDSRGRFTKGNRGGPGNPFARQVAALRRALLDSVTAEDIQAVAARLVEAAKGGDVSAARLLLSYALGKPAEAVDPDTLDVREWDLFGQQSTPAAQVDCVLGSIPVSLACDIARAALPGLRDAAAAQLVEALTEQPEEEAAEEEPVEVAVPPPPLPTPEELRPPRRRCGKGEAQPVDSAPPAPVEVADAPPAPGPVVPQPDPTVPSQEDGSARASADCPASGQHPRPCGEPALNAAPSERWGAATAGHGLGAGAVLALLLRGLRLPSPNGLEPDADETNDDRERP